MKKIYPFLLILGVVCIFFKSFFLQHLLPIPADTIVGLYNPYRDAYAKEFPRGIPFKNALITDPIRQQYPWKKLSIDLEKKLQVPLWNPYSFAGTPLLANFQSGALYPLNGIFFFLSFQFAWGIFIFLQPFLAGIFLYMYLQKMRISKAASILGAIVFAFSGFSVAWLVWGNIGHTILWLPLLLLSIENLFDNKNLRRKLVLWSFIFVFSICASFFAGHLQTFFYLYLLTYVYFLTRWFTNNKPKSIFVLFLILNSCFLILTFAQWFPVLQFILLSARSFDQQNWMVAGWFIPWQNLAQFIAPDFFGNPATLNYWGVWNYAEFVGYIGIVPLLLVFISMMYRHDKKTYFFTGIFIVSLLFALPNAISKIPFMLSIPLLSTAQPTRLLSLVDFSLSVLAALGLDYVTKNKTKIVVPIAAVSILIAALWVFIFFGKRFFTIDIENIVVAKHNLVLPTLLFLIGSSCLILNIYTNRLVQKAMIVALIGITVFDLFRFSDKFLPFTKSSYLYPTTDAIHFLQKNASNFRIMSTDSHIFPPNFPIIYSLQSIEGYDPLYLQSYGEFIAVVERNVPNVSGPFGFNRIITPHNYASPFINLLGVKYVLSISEIQDVKYKKVFQEGDTKIYENIAVLPRVFFVKEVRAIPNKKFQIQELFKEKFHLMQVAVVDADSPGPKDNLSVGDAAITQYSPNAITIHTNNNGNGFLVFTDVYYPTWHAYVDGKEVKILKTDYTFRGIPVFAGNHTIVFTDRFF